MQSYKETLDITQGPIHLTILLLDKEIIFKIKIDNKMEKYESSYTIEKLKQKSQLFSFFSTLPNAFKVFAKVKETKKYQFAILERKANINMIFNNGLEDFMFDILVEMIHISEEDKIEYKLNLLEDRVTNLEKLIKEKDDEIKSLKLMIKNNLNVNNKGNDGRKQIFKVENNELIAQINKRVKDLELAIKKINSKTYVEWGNINYNGNIWTGQIVNNERCGFGISLHPNGNYYRGTILDNKAQGYGIYVYSKGTIEQKMYNQTNVNIAFSGNFINDKLYGLSTLFYSDGKISTKHRFINGQSHMDTLESGENNEEIVTKKAKVLITEYLREQ